MEIKTFDELKEAVSKLDSLVHDEEGRGTYTWSMAYGELMKAIVNYWQTH